MGDDADHPEAAKPCGRHVADHRAMGATMRLMTDALEVGCLVELWDRDRSVAGKHNDVCSRWVAARLLIDVFVLDHTSL